MRPAADSAARTSEADRLSPLVRRFLKTAILFLLEGRVEFQGSLRRLGEITGESRLEPAVARLMQRKAS